jgi:hypothetical protein
VGHHLVDDFRHHCLPPSFSLPSPLPLSLSLSLPQEKTLPEEVAVEWSKIRRREEEKWSEIKAHQKGI